MRAANKGKQTELRLDIRLKAFQTGDKTMNSRERVMAALQLREPDRVPFMDFVDTMMDIFIEWNLVVIESSSVVSIS